MFTGIVAAVGRISRVAPQGDGLRLVVAPGGLDVGDLGIGDSVAVNGCCLTVVAMEHDTLAFDVSAETLRCTVGLDGASDVNLERALRLADRLGGHLMTGHVDGVGTVVAFAPVEGARAGIEPTVNAAAAGAPESATERVAERVATPPTDERSWRLVVEAPAALARFIATKGSIAVQGVSLTVNGVNGPRFEVNLIPHTLAVTTLGALTVGARVNLEVDLVARYVERLRSAP
jgi:riboflavin synthase